MRKASAGCGNFLPPMRNALRILFGKIGAGALGELWGNFRVFLVCLGCAGTFVSQESVRNRPDTDWHDVGQICSGQMIDLCSVILLALEGLVSTCTVSAPAPSDRRRRIFQKPPELTP